MLARRSIPSTLARGVICLLFNLIIWHMLAPAAAGGRGCESVIIGFLPAIEARSCAYPISPLSVGFNVTSHDVVEIQWGILIVGPLSVASFIVCFRHPKRRQTPGLCPDCGYDLRGSSGHEICPECGRMFKSVDPGPERNG